MKLPRPSNTKSGFSLIELLVVMTIMSIMVFTAAAVLGAISNGQTASQVSYDLKAVLEQARTVAMAQNTYVWVGFSPETNAQGNTGLEVMAVKGTTGQSSDLVNGLVTPMITPSYYPNIMLSQTVSITGMVTGASSVDISNSTIGSFTTNVGGTPHTFVQIIQFSPQSEVHVQSTLTPWITLGLAPIHGKASNAAALQIAGSTGTVNVF
jgi:prepilin-type N-terminal cleavage/methylation domain-containing protein